jgi:hypothetical protein
MICNNARGRWRATPDTRCGRRRSPSIACGRRTRPSPSAPPSWCEKERERERDRDRERERERPSPSAPPSWCVASVCVCVTFSPLALPSWCSLVLPPYLSIHSLPFSLPLHFTPLSWLHSLPCRYPSSHRRREAVRRRRVCVCVCVCASHRRDAPRTLAPQSHHPHHHHHPSLFLHRFCPAPIPLPRCPLPFHNLLLSLRSLPRFLSLALPHTRPLPSAPPWWFRCPPFLAPPPSSSCSHLPTDHPLGRKTRV